MARVGLVGGLGPESTLDYFDIPRIVDQARRASSMQGNPITLTDEELAETLRVAI